MTFRFSREHIPKLVEELKIPDVVFPGQGCRLPGDEALLIFLRQLAYPGRHTDLCHFFGRSTGYLSVVMNHMVEPESETDQPCLATLTQYISAVSH